MTLAIFDIDGTLVHGSTERRFWRYLLLHGYQGPRQLLAYVWFLLRYVFVYGIDVAKKNKAYLYRFETVKVRQLAAAFVAAEVLPRLYGPAVQRLRQHASRGDTVVLVSGTLEPIATALAAHLGAQAVRATVCCEHDGRYSARPPLVHPFGTAKLTLAEELAEALGTTLRHASAYGDSEHDLPLLRAVGRPVAVLPTPKLSAAAVENDWEIMAAGTVPHSGAVPH